MQPESSDYRAPALGHLHDTTFGTKGIGIERAVQSVSQLHLDATAFDLSRLRLKRTTADNRSQVVVSQHFLQDIFKVLATMHGLESRIEVQPNAGHSGLGEYHNGRPTCSEPMMYTFVLEVGLPNRAELRYCRSDPARRSW